MNTKHTIPSSSTTTTTNNTTTNNNNDDGAKVRTRARQPPVAERLAFAAPPAAGAGATSSGTDVPVSAPPTVTLPAIPNGFVPVTAAELRGHRALQSEVAAAPDAIAELQSFTNYAALFGITAPPVEQLVQRLTVASEWTTVLSESSAWYRYARSEYGLAWKEALELVEKLKAPFQLVTTANPALLSQYPSLARLLGASKVVSKRAAATRAKNKKHKAASAQSGAAAGAPGTPSAQAPASGTPASPAPSAEAASGPSTPPAAAPPRIVTVQG